MNAWIPVFMNAGVATLGALQGADWIHLAGSSQAGWIVSILGVMNTIAHAYSGAGPAAPTSPKS